MEQREYQAFEDAKLAASADLQTAPAAIERFFKGRSLNDRRTVIIRDDSKEER